MNIDDAIEAFAMASDEAPNEALLWSRQHWAEVRTPFLKMLRDYTDLPPEADAGDEGEDEDEDEDEDEEDTIDGEMGRMADALFFIIHLFGDRAEKDAYPILCELMLNEDRLLSTLGDKAAVDTLKGVLIRCFDGDVKPLQRVVEAEQADPITRGEALLALAWLARDGQWAEDGMRAYVRHLYQALKPKEPSYIWYNLVVVAALLGYQEFAAESIRLIKSGQVPAEWLTTQEWPDLQASGDAKGKEGLAAEEIRPFDDVIEGLADWPWPEDFEDEEPQMPITNPLRTIGRNDPCPCGSGKKFKNCHWEAE